MSAQPSAVTDRRRPAFCYQSLDALKAVREHFAAARLSTALGIYLVFTETANSKGGAAARDGFSATRKEIAEQAGVSLATLDRYVNEFAEIGVLEIDVQKVGKVNLPNVWALVDPPGRTHASTLTDEEPHARSLSGKEEVQVQDQEQRQEIAADAALDTPPKIPRVNGRNLPLDALAEVVPGTDLASKASRDRTTTALYGGKTTQGIIAQFWVECVREDEARGTNWCARCHEEPDVFAAALASAIRAKAAMYPAKVAGMMTALSLQSYWLGLEQMPNLNGKGGLSAAQMAAFPDA